MWNLVQSGAGASPLVGRAPYTVERLDTRNGNIMNPYVERNQFLSEVYPNLSPEGKRKADLLLDEYVRGGHPLTATEVDEAGKILAQIIKTHTVEEVPQIPWTLSWKTVLTIIVVNTLVLVFIFKADWLLAFISAWGAAAAMGILVALLIAFSKAKGTE